MSIAKFHDISTYIDDQYENIGYVKMNIKEFNNKIKNYIEQNEDIKSGDILFVGSKYESRQEYGFCLVIDKDFFQCNYGPNLPIKYKDKLPENINYRNLLEFMKNDEYLDSLWYGDDMYAYNEILQKYIENKLY